jgi:hypothetical protein
MVVARFSETGDERFATVISLAGPDTANALALGADGSIYVGGKTSTGGGDAFIARLDATGKLQERRTIDSSGSDSVTALAIGDDGNLLALTNSNGVAQLRRGVATALLDHLAARARNDSVRAVVGLLDPQERDGALPFFISRGFRCVDRMTTFESKVEVMAAWLFERLAWLRERGEIPASAQIVPLREVPIGPVAELHARSIAGTVPQLEAFFTELARGPDGGDSVVLLIDDVVCGYHQYEFRGNLGTTHALAVSEDLRGGAIVCLFLDRGDLRLRGSHQRLGGCAGV